MIELHAAPLRQLPPDVLYSILQLRVDVFVVEQDCAYPELDGRDLEAGAILLWASDADTVVATLRVLDEPGGRARIGRVATAADHRGSGVAAALMQAAIEQVPGREIELHAQAHLEKWYERFGFRRSGPEFVEDGIPHVPMSRGDDV
jgi:ElaA protein